MNINFSEILQIIQRENLQIHNNNFNPRIVAKFLRMLFAVLSLFASGLSPENRKNKI